MVAPAQSRKLYDALQAQHVPSELIVYPGVEQDFSGGGTKAIADMTDFIAKTFPAPKMMPADKTSAKSSKAAKSKPSRSSAKAHK